MNNYVQPGEVLTLSVPTGGVTVNKGVLIGTAFVVATETVAAASGAIFTGVAAGVVAIDKLNTEVWAEGDKIYWDNANTRVTNAPTAGCRLVGHAVAAAANPSTTGKVRLGEVPALVSMASSPAPASYATAGAQTYTAADILGGIIVRDPNGASRSDVLPTAALLVAALPGARVGDLVDCLIVNGADAAETITIGAGAGGAFDANQTAASRVIGQNSQKSVVIRLTNVTPASEAYVVYA
jgi:predicted RecA/RadA family phage recombinase